MSNRHTVLPLAHFFPWGGETEKKEEGGGLSAEVPAVCEVGDWARKKGDRGKARRVGEGQRWSWGSCDVSSQLIPRELMMDKKYRRKSTKLLSIT